MANTGKLNAIQEMIMEAMKATEVKLSPEVFNYLSKNNYVVGSINWYNALEALPLNPGVSGSIKTNVTDFFYYKWAPYLGNQLLNIFAIEDKDIPKLQKAAATQVENFMSNPRNKDAFWGGNFDFAKCICYYKVAEGMRNPDRRANDIEDVRGFIKLVFDAFHHWLGGGSVSYKFGKGQQRINAAFMSSTPIGDSQSSIVAMDDGNGGTALYYKRSNKPIKTFDQLLAYRGQEMAGGSSSGGFRTSIWRLFRDVVALNPDFYDSDDLVRALGIKDPSTSNIAQDAYKLVQQISAGKTEDVFYDLTKDVIFNDKQSQQRVKDAAASFPTIYDSVMGKKSGKYFDICNKIKADAHLDLAKGLDKDSTHGVGAGEELQNLFRSLFLVNTTLAFNDYQRKGTLSSGTLGDQVQVKESKEKMHPALETLNEDTAQPLDDDQRKEGEKNKSKIRRLITDLGLNWSGSFLEYFDILMNYSQKNDSDNLYTWEGNADIKKPIKAETPYQILFSYYLLYLASILNLGDDYSLKNIYKNLQKENKYTEQVLLTLAYVEGRVYTQDKSKYLAYTYEDRSALVTKGGDLDNFRGLASKDKDLDSTEVQKLLDTMKSRQADGESILGMVWDDYKEKCKTMYPDYNMDGSNVKGSDADNSNADSSDGKTSGYTDKSLDNLYSLCKELYSEGKEAIAKGLIKLLSEVIQKNVVAVKEPLPL